MLACEHVSNEDLLSGRVEEAVRRVLVCPVPPPPDLDGAARGAARILAIHGEGMARPPPPG